MQSEQCHGSRLVNTSAAIDSSFTVSILRNFDDENEVEGDVRDYVNIKEITT